MCLNWAPFYIKLISPGDHDASLIFTSGTDTCLCERFEFPARGSLPP